MLIIKFKNSLLGNAKLMFKTGTHIEFQAGWLTIDKIHGFEVIGDVEIEYAEM